MGLSQRYFAAFMQYSDGVQERLYGDRKADLFHSIAPGSTVVEIGSGTGVNLPYLPADVRYVGVDPNPHMHAALRENPEARNRNIELHEARAEALPLPDASADAVLSTLVLCSVDDPAQALSEVRRVLEPGGRFYFIEHVAASPNSTRRRVQRSIKPVWRGLADGCRPDRDTGTAIEQAGFADVQYERFPVGSVLNPVRPHIAGTAWTRERK